eukprot:7709518-Karenia_brevis.AAC.1
MGRLGNRGRNNSKSDLSKSIQSMAAACLLRAPGIATVMHALTLYRQDCSSGIVQVSPSNAFKHSHCKWLLDS